MTTHPRTGRLPAPTVLDLQQPDHFQPLTALGHTDLAHFVTTFYWRRRSWVTWFHYLFTLCALGLWVAAGWQAGRSVDDWLQQYGSAFIAFIVLVPIHELIHGAAYRAQGARDIRYGVSLRQLYAYAIAHHFVAGQRAFAWVAVAPFVVINTALVVAALLLPAYQGFLFAVLLLHTVGAAGDCAMLNYLWLHRHQEVYTYDDAGEQKSYFYARRSD